MRGNLFSVLILFVALFLGACDGRDANRSNGNRASGNSNTAANANAVSNANPNANANANSANANTNVIVERPEDISKGLLQMEDAWNDAYGQKNEEWFQQNLADDYTEIGDTGKTINDKAGAIAEMKADKSTEIITAISDTKVRVEGNSAVVTGINHVKLKDPAGKPVDYKHRFTDTFVKRNDKWQVWADQATRIP